jgi:hypothetical protein
VRVSLDSRTEIDNFVIDKERTAKNPSK